MSVSPEDVRTVARLAQLAIAPEAVEDLQGKMNNILCLVEEMNRFDTKEVLPMAHSFDLCQRLREDEITQEDVSLSAMKLAPRSEANLYLVPWVMPAGDDKTRGE